MGSESYILFFYRLIFHNNFNLFLKGRKKGGDKTGEKGGGREGDIRLRDFIGMTRGVNIMKADSFSYLDNFLG